MATLHGRQSVVGAATIDHDNLVNTLSATGRNDLRDRARFIKRRNHHANGSPAPVGNFRHLARIGVVPDHDVRFYTSDFTGALLASEPGA
jgi:hypothetical protein